MRVSTRNNDLDGRGRESGIGFSQIVIPEVRSKEQKGKNKGLWIGMKDNMIRHQGQVLGLEEKQSSWRTESKGEDGPRKGCAGQLWID